MPDTEGLKKRLRREIKARAAALTGEYRAAADRAVREALLASEQWRDAGAVFLFVSMWAEPDTRALLDDALRAGKRVYVPLCCPGYVMKAVRVRSPGELRPGMRGIPEPPDDSETAVPGELDLALVPCVTASAAGARLGHGAGYYDRFLREHRCASLCLCYEALLTDEIPMEDTDVWMDYVVTEQGIRKTG